MAALGLRFRARAFSSCSKRGPLFIAVRGPLTVAASLVAEHRLQTCRLSSCGSRAQLLRGMWDLPRTGLEPVSPALAGRFSTTVPPGKPPKSFWHSGPWSLPCYPSGLILYISRLILYISCSEHGVRHFSDVTCFLLWKVLFGVKNLRRFIAIELLSISRSFQEADLESILSKDKIHLEFMLIFPIPIQYYRVFCCCCC